MTESRRRTKGWLPIAITFLLTSILAPTAKDFLTSYIKKVFSSESEWDPSISTDYKSNPTAEEAVNDIKSAPTLQRENRCRDYEGSRVKWKLTLNNLRNLNENTVELVLWPEDDPMNIFVRVDRKQYPEVRTAKEGYRVWVAGTISKCTDNIEISDAKIHVAPPENYFRRHPIWTIYSVLTLLWAIYSTYRMLLLGRFGPLIALKTRGKTLFDETIYGTRPFPHELKRSIQQAPLLHRDKYAGESIGRKLQWRTRLVGMERSQGDLVRLRVTPEHGDYVRIIVVVEASKNPLLDTVAEDSILWVAGTLSKCDVGEFEISEAQVRRAAT